VRDGLDGLDVVVEGQAVEVGDEAERQQVANTYESNYGARFTAPEGTWFGLGDAIRAGRTGCGKRSDSEIAGRRTLSGNDAAAVTGPSRRRSSALPP
jgi:hypothetical protein